MTTATRKELFNWGVILDDDAVAAAPDGAFTLAEVLEREELTADIRLWLACIMLSPRTGAALAVDCAAHLLSMAAAHPGGGEPRAVIATGRGHLAGSVTRREMLAAREAARLISRAAESTVAALEACAVACDAEACVTAGIVADDAGYVAAAEVGKRVYAALRAATGTGTAEAGWQLDRAREYAATAAEEGGIS